MRGPLHLQEPDQVLVVARHRAAPENGVIALVDAGAAIDEHLHGAIPDRGRRRLQRRHVLLAVPHQARAEPRVRVRIRAVAQQPPRVGMTRHGGGFGQRHAAAIEATRNAERCARKPQDAEHDPRGTRNDNGLQRNH